MSPEEDGLSFRAWFRQLDAVRDGTGGACLALFLLVCLVAAVISVVAGVLIMTGIVDF